MSCKDSSEERLEAELELMEEAILFVVEFVGDEALVLSLRPVALVISCKTPVL